MSDYMSYLKEKVGYTSLKMQFLEMQFPALGEADKHEGGFGHMEDPLDIDCNEPNKDEIEELKIQLSDMHKIQQELVETKARLKLSDTIISLLFSDPSFREIYENGFASLFITDLARSVKACVCVI